MTEEPVEARHSRSAHSRSAHSRSAATTTPRAAKKRPNSVRFEAEDSGEEKFTNARKSVFVRPEVLPEVNYDNPNPPVSECIEPLRRRQKSSKVSFSGNTFVGERYTNARKSIFPEPAVESDSENEVFKSETKPETETEVQFPPINPVRFWVLKYL